MLVAWDAGVDSIVTWAHQHGRAGKRDRHRRHQRMAGMRSETRPSHVSDRLRALSRPWPSDDRGAVSVFGLVFAGVGLLLVAAGAGITWYAVRFRARALRAAGVVVAVRHGREGSSPVVSFRTAEGHWTQGQTPVRLTPPVVFKGNHVTVLYHPEHPARAYPARHLGCVAVLGIGLAAFAMIFVVIGVIALLAG